MSSSTRNPSGTSSRRMRRPAHKSVRITARADGDGARGEPASQPKAASTSTRSWPSRGRNSSSSMAWKAASSSSLLANNRFNSSGEVASSTTPAASEAATSAPFPPQAAVASKPRMLFSTSARCSCVAPLLNMPAPMILRSKSNFSLHLRSICRSTGESLNRRNTRTSFVWPNRCARAIACLSFCGFQSRSNKITVSAACRLRPKPPARAERRKTYKSPAGSLNAWICLLRSSCGVCPSSRA
mmetsp:Transcript_11424/g.23112  ORF Transcript_11424/g.23112 Transcript_11424/m.23112 type:complete len:242 (-) Transcript_11424:1046-1771(-)